MPPDPIQFTPTERDVRVERSGWVYYVRAIKRGERFVGGGLTLEGGLLAIPVALLMGRRLVAWHDRQPWKVGVVRLRSDGGGLVRTVYKERLADGSEPDNRVAELVADVRLGKFHRD